MAVKRHMLSRDNDNMANVVLHSYFKFRHSYYIEHIFI